MLGTDDTPAMVGSVKFDPHDLVIDASSHANPWVIRIVWGTGTFDEAVVAHQYSDLMVTEAKKGTPVTFKMRRLNSGADKVWVSGKSATNNATLNFFIGTHEYEG